jgi:hypothetical protein
MSNSMPSAPVLRSDSEAVELGDVPSPESEEAPKALGESLQISSGIKSRFGGIGVSAQGLTWAALAPSSMRPFWRACRGQLLIKLQFSSIAEDGIPTSCSSRLISGQSSSTLSDAVFVRNDNTDPCRNPTRCSAAYLFSFLVKACHPGTVLLLGWVDLQRSNDQEVQGKSERLTSEYPD